MHLSARRMLLSPSRVKQGVSRSVSYIYGHRRILLLIFFILPLTAYLLAWILCNTEAFFPRPLREAKEVLIVVAHPDDECTFPPIYLITSALFFSPSILRTLRSGKGNGNMLVLSSGVNLSRLTKIRE